MDQSRSDILAQLASGTISAEQAAAQLREGAAPTPPEMPVPPVEATPPQAPGAPSLPRNLGQRWMHIRVTDLNTGKGKVNVNLPLTWVAAGLRIGANYAPQLENLDLAQLLGELEAGAGGQLIDVEDLDDGERVQIFVD